MGITFVHFHDNIDADDPCTGFVCQRGSSCKVDDQTGDAYCEPSCDLDNGGCRGDQICELQTVQCVRAPCPPIVNCRGESRTQDM